MPGRHQLQRAIAVLLRPIADGPYKGIVIWNDGTVRTTGATVTLRGGTQLDIGGTIYSPKSLVTIDGGATVAGVDRAAVQVIAWQFDVGGNSGSTCPTTPTSSTSSSPRALFVRSHAVG